jgi:acetolactate synthase-1/2/3 large subunit
MKINGAEQVIQLLEQLGVSVVTGVPGGAVLPLYEALGASNQIRHILARHEQAAGFIAQGIARVTHRAGVCLVTSGPGLTNVVTALADARLDSVPLVCISGQVSTHLIGTDAFQEVATADIVASVTKACYSVESADEVAEAVIEAFYLAEHGRCGPVVIDLPKDVQMQLTSKRDLQARAAVTPAPAPLRERSLRYDEAAALIAAAERPVLYCGGGVIAARAQQLVRQLAEGASIPVVTTLMAIGLLPPEHALNLGMLGMHGARYTNQVIDAADLLVAIGVRFDDRATGDPGTFAPRAKVIHIDIDPRELGKIRTPTVAIQDDASAALHELIRRIAPDPRAGRPREGWIRCICDLKRSYPLLTPRVDQLCSPYGIMRALGEVLPQGAVVTTDVGQHQMWAAQALPLRPSNRWLTSGGLGTMGFGLPAAIGAALACPEASVVCISGDGSLLMNIQELVTLAELELNVKVIVLDNGALGLVRQQQQLFYGQCYVGSRYRQYTDFVAVATAFGIPALDLGEHPSPDEALRRTFGEPGPRLIRVPIDEREHVLPMVRPGGANIEALDRARVD